MKLGSRNSTRRLRLGLQRVALRFAASRRARVSAVRRMPVVLAIVRPPVSTGWPPTASARLEVEEVQLARVDDDLDRLVDAARAMPTSKRATTGSLVASASSSCDDGGVEVGRDLLHLLGEYRLAADLEMGDQLGAQRLDRAHDGRAGGGSAGAPLDRGVLDVLGPQPSADGAADVAVELGRIGQRVGVARAATGRRCAATRSPLRRSSSASKRFMAGLPMKLATNRLAGAW